ncbi:MAG: hypothetical protein RSB43_10990 [Niameybacter sp.]
MKNIKSLLLTLVLGCILTGCTHVFPTKPKAETEYEPKSLVGYMSIEEDKIYWDEVELVTSAEEERIAELDLTIEDDLPNGYYIYNPIVEVVVFHLTEDTVYTFTDVGLHFVKEAEGNRIYETTKQEEFLEASSYEDKPLADQGIPYFIKAHNKKVISITEELIYTQ